MLHQIMYERVCRMLVEFKNDVGRRIRDFRVIFLSRFHCKCSWASHDSETDGRDEGIESSQIWAAIGLSGDNFPFGNPHGLLLLMEERHLCHTPATGTVTLLCDWEGLPLHIWAKARVDGGEFGV